MSQRQDNHDELLRMFGVMQAQIAHLQKDMEAQKEELAEMHDMLMRTRGGWVVLTALVTAGVMLGGFLSWLLHIWKLMR